MKNKTKLAIKVVITFSIFLLIGFGIYKYFTYKQYIDQSPYNVLITDISQDSVTISWETEDDSKTFIKLGDSDTQLGSGDSLKVHTVKLEGTQSSSNYSFKISDGKRDWIEPMRENSTEYALTKFQFTTPPRSENITLPIAQEIELEPNSTAYALLKFEDKVSTLVTISSNRFGSAIIDKNVFLDKDFEPFYPTEDTEIVVLKPYDNDSTQSLNIINNFIVKAYASEINCNQKVSEQTSSAISKEAYTDLANRFVANRGKNYASECYNDVIYRAKVAGFDPAFVLTIWLNESGASNYTQSDVNSGIIEDFGIHGNPNVPVQDFNAQINYFLSLAFQYNCPGLSYWEAWGNMYRWGSCNADDLVKRQQGIDYYKGIEVVYGYVTNGKSLPSKINGYEKMNPTDPGDDDGDSENVTDPLCCAIKLDNRSSFKGDFENNSEGKTCSDIWSEGRSVYDGKVEYSVEIDGKEGSACEVDYVGICCNIDGKTAWYPKLACKLPVENVDEKTCNLSNDINSYTLSLKEGINFIGLDFNPVKDISPMLASQLLESNSNVLLIASFGTYQWENILKKSESKPFAGEDFELYQNLGYLVLTDKDINITIEGWKDTNAQYKSLSEGWNLVGGSLYTSSFTSSKLVQKLAEKDIKVSTIAVWNNDLGHFEYRRESEDSTYGEDIEFITNQGIFLRAN